MAYANSLNYKKALQICNEMINILQKHYIHIQQFGTEDQLQSISIEADKYKNTLINIYLKCQEISYHAKSIVFESLINFKSRVLERQRKLSDAISQASEDIIRDKFKQYLLTQESIIHHRHYLFNKMDELEYNKNLEKLEQLNEKLQLDLSVFLKENCDEYNYRIVTLKEVCNLLPRDTVLIEFVKFNFSDMLEHDHGRLKNSQYYLALICKGGIEDSIEIECVGPAQPIDDLVIKYKQSMKSAIGSKECLWKKLGREIYNRVFDPLMQYLEGNDNLIIVPDSVLCLIPFEVFIDTEGHFLIDNYTVRYLNSSRDIVSFENAVNNHGEIVLIGDPDFDINLKGVGKIKSEPSCQLIDESDNLASQYRHKEYLKPFRRLFITGDEVENIGNLLRPHEKVNILVGVNASEKELFKQISPKIVHIASHGYFYESIRSGREANEIGFTSRIIDINNELPNILKKLPSNKAQCNHLYSSGIALAGANRTIMMHSSNSNIGLLTPDKVAQLNLKNTEMVVLSACETGLGSTTVSEGVFGLRRAFFQAGAMSLVMSMWEVPNSRTVDIMESFYSKYLIEKLDKWEALRQAALDAKEITEKDFGTSNPYYWGAFIFVG